MSANARFNKALLDLLDRQDAVHAATTPMSRALASTIHNDAMLAVQLMYSAEHAAGKRIQKRAKAASTDWMDEHDAGEPVSQYEDSRESAEAPALAMAGRGAGDDGRGVTDEFEEERR